MKKIELVANRLAVRIRRGELSPGERMPSLRWMAQECALSYVSMRRVYRILCDRGVLVKELGVRGRYVVSASPGQRPPRRARSLAEGSRAEQIARVLEDEVLGGMYLPDCRLPSVKEVCARFECGTLTARRALSRLEGRGVARRVGRRLYGGGAAQVSTSRLWLLVTPGSFASYRDHIQSFLTSVERARLRLRWQPVRTLGSCSRDVLRAVSPHEVAGLIRAPGSRVDSGDWRELLQALPGTPIVDVDPTGAAVPVPGGGRRRYRITPDHRAAAGAVGSLLKELGHRHIAFITHLPFRAHPWVEQRAAGLRCCYPAHRVGERPSCTFVRLPPQVVPPEFRKMLHGLSANLRRVSDMPSELIEEYLNGLPHLFRHGQSARDAHVLDGLSREPRITAWVCLNDDIASVALRYLQRRRRRVPEDVSVVGFDNRHIAARMNLTSYDFGFDKMGHLAVGCLAGQGRAAAQLVSRVTVEGDLVVRATAGSPRKAATVRPGMSLRPGLPAPGVSRHLEHR